MLNFPRRKLLKWFFEMNIAFSFGLLVLLWRQISSSFIDVTERVGISAINGYLAAFGDFNGDKQTDLFLVTRGGNYFCGVNQSRSLAKEGF